MKRVAIIGGAGRMGQVMARGLGAEPDVTLSVLVDVHEPSELFGARYAHTIDEIDADSVDAVVEFSVPDSVVASARWCAAHQVALVIGTTGLDDVQRGAVREASASTSIVMASNFSVGAVLSERFARLAAPYFDRVEIVELHHDRKADAPSGTALAAARAIAAARATAAMAPMDDPTSRHTLEGSRGADAGDGVRIHSVRLAGLVAHQEILFGGPGEGLTIRHDSFDRVSFVQGVALALRSLHQGPGLTEGIDSFIA